MTNLVKLAQSHPSALYNVIFLHGLNGNAYTTWTCDGNLDMFWPLWLANDLSYLNIYTLNYAAPASNWLGTGMSLKERSTNILERLLVEPAMLDRPITFICHSLGGLIVKQMLREAKDREHYDKPCAAFITRVNKVVFMGTPHFGSGYATLLDRVRFLLWPTEVALDLVKNNPSLMELNRWYRNFSPVHSGVIKNLDFYETHGTPIGRIVPRGDPGLPCTQSIGIDCDHVSICKPKSRTDLIYLKTQQFLTDNAERDQQKYGTEVQDNLKETLTNLPRLQSVTVLPRLVRLAAVLVILLFFYWYLTPAIAVVDLERSIDLRNLSCGDGGNRVDRADLIDTYSFVTKAPSSFNKNAEVNLPLKYAVHAFDLGILGAPEVPYRVIRKTPELETRNYNFSVVNGQTRIRWEWTNAHGSDEDGIFVTKGWTIRDLTIRYSLPPGVNISQEEFAPEGIQAKCTRPAGDLIECHALFLNDDISISWKWNMWEHCPFQPK